MEKDEIVEAVRKRTDIGKQQADELVDAVFAAITDTLKGSTEVRLGGFSVARHGAAAVHKRRSGEKAKNAAPKQPKFAPGRRLRSELLSSSRGEAYGERHSQPGRALRDELISSLAAAVPGGISEGPGAEAELALFRRAADLLGGPQVLRHGPQRRLDVHEALMKGLPREALAHLLDKVSALRHPDLMARAIGVSQRTSQRMRAAPGKSLSSEQSGRIWQFAEILARATDVFGSQEEAVEWLQRPAMALDRQRPIDLLATVAGAKLVENLLGRLEYGVYT